MDINVTMPLATTCHDEVHWTRQGVSGLAASGNKASIEKLRLTFDASEVSDGFCIQQFSIVFSFGGKLQSSPVSKEHTM